MAVNETSTTGQNTQESAMGNAFRQADTAYQNQNQGKDSREGFRLSGSMAHQMFGVQLGSFVTGDVAGRFVTTGNNYLEKNSKLVAQGVITKLIPLNVEDDPRLGVSAVLVINTVRDNPMMSYHVVLLAGSIDPLQDKIFSAGPGIGGVSVKQFVSDAIRPQFTEIVNQNISQIAGSMRPVFSDSEVFLADKDPSNEEHVGRVIFNAIAANISELSKNRTGFRDLDLSAVKADGALVISPTFNNPNMEGPTRADIRVPFNVIPRGLDAQHDGFARPSRLTEIGLFMDLIYNGQPSQMFSQQQQQQSPAVYIAQAVISSIKIPSNCYTNGSVMLALATTMSVVQNNVWIQAFKKQHTGAGKLDLRDVGAVGIDLNLDRNQNGFGSPIDTNVAAFTDAYLYQMMSSIVSGVQISIDVPECGPETFYTSFFAAAAAGNTQAHRALFDATNALTGGAFARHFDPATPIVVNDNMMILNGYFTNTKGERVDLREIDYLAVLNTAHANGDYSIIDVWANSLYNTGIRQEQALADRARIISGIAGDAVFTGRSRRVTFTDKFVMALAKSMSEVGINIEVQGLGYDVGGAQRAVPGGRFANAVLTPGAVGGFMNRGMGGMGAASSLGRNWVR